MARTSRKNQTVKENVKMQYHVGVYLRLSASRENATSNSIENQKLFIEEFLKDKQNFEVVDYYNDTNVSGTTFERSGFNQMLEDIKSNKINCVVVKDLSRLGRNAIETGYYIQQVFPSCGVRFISILDKFDTIDGITNIDDTCAGIRIPLINIMNQAYSDDIKRKTQTCIDTKIKEGKFVSSKAPFGYKKSDASGYQLAVDFKAGEIIKLIFSMAEQNLSLNEIVRRLNISNISTPIQYALSNGLQGNYDGGDTTWNSRSVKYILMNRTYTGDLEQGKEKYIVENTHEPLVSREIFFKVQDRFKKSEVKIKSSDTPENPLKGKIICGTCGGKMQRRKGSSKAGWYFFTCITNNRKGCSCDTGMYIRESEIMSALSDIDICEVKEILIYPNSKVEVKLEG